MDQSTRPTVPAPSPAVTPARAAARAALSDLARTTTRALTTPPADAQRFAADVLRSLYLASGRDTDAIVCALSEVLCGHDDHAARELEQAMYSALAGRRLVLVAGGAR